MLSIVQSILLIGIQFNQLEQIGWLHIRCTLKEWKLDVHKLWKVSQLKIYLLKKILEIHLVGLGL